MIKFLNYLSKKKPSVSTLQLDFRLIINEGYLFNLMDDLWNHWKWCAYKIRGQKSKLNITNVVREHETSYIVQDSNQFF